MAVSKDIEKGTWTSQVWVEDWQGKKKHKKRICNEEGSSGMGALHTVGG